MLVSVPITGTKYLIPAMQAGEDDFESQFRTVHLWLAGSKAEVLKKGLREAGCRDRKEPEQEICSKAVFSGRLLLLHPTSHQHFRYELTNG